MERIAALFAALAAVLFWVPPPGLAAGGEDCAKYSDSFDAYHAERWQEVLLYSAAKAGFAIRDGRLMLNTPANEPCEVQVYSLFTFEGDLDVQVDYDIVNAAQLRSKECRFNTGLVLQTLGDEQSYKCYVAMTPEKGLLYRARVDQFGEQGLETFKENPAPPAGALRLKRQSGQIQFLVLDKGQWVTMYEFQKPCREKLRIRFKLQTGGDREPHQSCPVQVNFDNFKVNSCSRIIEE